MSRKTDTAIPNKVELPEVVPVNLPEHLERIRLLNVEQLAALLGFIHPDQRPNRFPRHGRTIGALPRGAKG